MPLSRYQIRNEYSLTDPELYKAADKDDPEALLEGVAMAGLVGVLRQLGDLAEFAAEIFHDLHEEVMVTAARCHSLMVRVQQLESEFPAIEKAFLSQTNHSSFFYNPGIEWHPNMHMNQNLITRGDLPRFIMDSYEECRGPPRLFLLDKFDVGGAGACLKRYTDPSFFKVETASFGITSTDVQREKKARKAKKKGSRWRNGETPEALSTSHAKLHQLFLEESIENGIKDPAHRVKLKRRLNGFPFHNKSGKSYMEKFLESPSPDHKEVYEIPVDSSPLALPSSSDYESGDEILKISTLSPEKESKQRSIIQSSSPNKEGTNTELSIDELNVIPSGADISEVLERDPGLGAYHISDPGLEAYNIPSTLHKADSEKDIAVDEQSKADDSVDDYESDDIASEIDNYMDALTTMESEMDTDSELKTKNELRYWNSSREATELYANAEQLQAHSSDSQSMGISTLSDDGNSSSKKDMSSFSCSDTHSTSADITPSDGEVTSNVFPSAEIHEPEIIDTSMARRPNCKEDQMALLPEIVVSDGATVEAAKIPEKITDLGDPTPTSTSNLLGSAPAYRSAEALMEEGTVVDKESDKLLTNISLNLHYISSISDASQPKEEDSPSRLTGENQHNDTSESLPGPSYLSVPSHTKDDFPLEVLAENQLGDELNDEVLNLDKNAASTPYLAMDSPQNNGENSPILSTEDQPLDVLHFADPNLNENASFASGLSDIPLLHRDCFSHMSAEKLSGKGLGGRDPNSISDASVSLSNIMEDSGEKKTIDNSVDRVPEIGNMEEHCVQISDNHGCHQNPVIPFTEEQPFDSTHYSGIEAGDTFSGVDDINPPAGGITLNLNYKEDSSSVGAFVSQTVDAAPIRSSKEGTSYFAEDHFDEPSDTGDGAGMGKASCNLDLLERESAEEPSLLAASHAHLDGIDDEPVNVASDSAGLDTNAVECSDGSSVEREILQEGSLSSFDGEHIASRTANEACFSDRSREMDITRDANQQKLGVVNNDHSESQMLGEVSDTHLIYEAKDTLNLDNSSIIQSSIKQNEPEPFLPEEPVEALPNPLAERFLNACEAKSESLTQLQQAQHSDHADHARFDASSKSLPANLPHQSSLLLSPSGSKRIEISEQSVDSLSSISSSFSLLPDANQIYGEERPPMPPLPPVQWRMGRLQHAFPAEGVSVQHNAAPFPPLLLSKADREALPLNPFLHQSVLQDEKSPLVSGQPSVVQLGEVNDDMVPLEGSQFRDTFLQFSSSDGEMQQNHSQAEREKEESTMIKHLYDEDRPSAYSLGLPHEQFFKPLNKGAAETGLKEKELVQSSAISEENARAIDTTAQPSKAGNEQPEQALPDSAYSSGLSPERLTRPLNQLAPQTSIKDKELGQSSGYPEENPVTCDITSLPSTTESEQPRDKTAFEETSAWPAAEDEKPNGHRRMKVPRSRNPLIDAVAAHDKSKLRKVTERVRPEIQKEDERDSLLEQIRTKSFNLKSAVVSRPSIQGPKTNLKVAAILEKAKTIRQAFAGSDEDDDDSWSDS